MAGEQFGVPGVVCQFHPVAPAAGGQGHREPVAVAGHPGEPDGADLAQPEQAAQGVLGGLLLDNLAWDRAADLLTDSDFYRHEHRLIYAAVGALVSAGKPADVITVFEHLQAQGKAADCGGLAYLNALAQSVPSAANMRRYAEIVRERAVLRKLIAASDEIATTAFNTQGRPVTQILDEAESKIFKIGEEGSRQRQGFQGIDKLVTALIDRVNELAENGAEEVTGVRSGFYDMDRMTAGLQKGDLIVLAARPSMGKTAFALNIAEAAALPKSGKGEPVATLIFSLEMSASQLALRMLCARSRVNMKKLRDGLVSRDGEEINALGKAGEEFKKAPILVDDSSALTIMEMRAKARRIYARRKLGLIMEPSAAVVIAAARDGRLALDDTSVLVITGGNIDSDVLHRWLAAPPHRS